MVGRTAPDYLMRSIPVRHTSNPNRPFEKKNYINDRTDKRHWSIVYQNKPDPEAMLRRGYHGVRVRPMMEPRTPRRAGRRPHHHTLPTTFPYWVCFQSNFLQAARPSSPVICTLLKRPPWLGSLVPAFSSWDAAPPLCTWMLSFCPLLPGLCRNAGVLLRPVRLNECMGCLCIGVDRPGEEGETG